MKAIIIEDNPEVAEAVSVCLQLRWPDINIGLALDGSKGLELSKSEYVDIVVLDLNLPDIDGLDILRQIRSFSDVPIVILTVRGMEDDIAKGLETGADDYIVKPFNTEELLLRINAVIRRTVSNSNLTENISICGFEYNYPLQSLKFRDIHYKLSTKENELLCILLQNKNCVVERNFVLNKIWNNDSYFASRSMDVYISKLRSYFKDTSSVEIANIHGKGFKLLVKE